MKNLISLLLLCSILISGSLNAQWEPCYGFYKSFGCMTFKDSLMLGGSNDGVYISTNQGYGWKKSSTGLQDHSTVAALVILGQNIYAGTDKGLYVSYDAVTWHLADSNFNNLIITSIILKNNQLFAGTWGRGVWQLSDNGQTWKEVSVGLSNFYVRSLALKGNDIIAGTNGGIYTSTDNGDSWKVIYDHPSILSVVTCGNNIIALVWYGGGKEKLIYSTDYGNTWNDSNLNGNGNLFSDGEKIFYRNFDVLHRSTDQGISWTAINNKAVRVIARRDSLLYSSDNSFSRDDGVTWKKLGTYVGNLQIYSSCISGKNVLLYGNNYTSLDLYFSNDNGFSWGIVDMQELDEPVKDQWFAFRDTIYVPTNNGLYSTSDYGITWNLINNNIGRYGYVSFTDRVVFIAYESSTYISMNQGRSLIKVVLPFPGYAYLMDTNNNFIFFVMTDNKIIRTSDHGKTWQDISILSYPLIHLDHLIYFNGFLYTNDREKGMFRSSNNGDSWEKLDLPFVYSITHDDKNLYISIGAGVCSSSDYGNTWDVIATPMEWSKLLTNGEYIFVPDPNQISVGIQRLKLNKVTSVDNIQYSGVDYYSLRQNYPNPFNPVTTISYSIPSQSFVELKVYDMLGREVTTLVSKEQSTGEYNVQFNASSLPSGVYVYSLKSGKYNSSRKLVLLK